MSLSIYPPQANTQIANFFGWGYWLMKPTSHPLNVFAHVDTAYVMSGVEWISGGTSFSEAWLPIRYASGFWAANLAWWLVRGAT